MIPSIPNINHCPAREESGFPLSLLAGKPMHAPPLALSLPFSRLRPNFASGYLQAPHSMAVRGAIVFFMHLGNASTSISKPSCGIQRQDADQGFNPMYCTCDETINLPLPTPTPDNGDISSSCRYQSYPASVKPSPSLPSPSTRPAPTLSCEVQEEELDQGISASCPYISFPACVELGSSLGILLRLQRQFK